MDNAKINSLLDEIDKKNEEIDKLKRDIELTLMPQLNEECKKVIFEKFKRGIFVTHKEKWVFRVWDVRNCLVITDSFYTIDSKSLTIAKNDNGVGICRAVSLIDNARLSKLEEIEDFLEEYNIEKKKRDSE